VRTRLEPAIEGTAGRWETDGDELRRGLQSVLHFDQTALEEKLMTATYTFDVFCSLDGYGSYDSNGDWGGYWGKQGPEFLGER